jgi:hypothetical protein
MVKTRWLTKIGSHLEFLPFKSQLQKNFGKLQLFYLGKG